MALLKKEHLEKLLNNEKKFFPKSCGQLIIQRNAPI